MRFRCTALPTFVVTVIPRRVLSEVFGFTKIKKWGVWMRRPVTWTCLYSLRFFRRSQAEYRCACLCERAGADGRCLSDTLVQACYFL